MRAVRIGMALVLAGPALAAEEEIRIGLEGSHIVGTLQTPEGGAAPVVLMLHGFTGTRDELLIEGTEEGVFARTARHLEEAGYASLRIDFRGSGDSDGDWADTTFSGQVADALEAIDWLKGSDEVDAERLAVLGWSQGGLVAAHVAAAAPEDVDALILWAPATAPAANFVNIFGPEATFAAIAAEAGEEITLSLPWGVDTTLKGAFFDEMLTMHAGAAVAGYDGPMQVFMGLNDTTILPQPGAGEMLLRYHDGPEELHELEMDHVFNVFTGPETLDGEMIPKVVAFLRQTLP